MLARPAGRTSRIDAVNAQLAELATAEGRSYRPDLTKPTNSHLALELLHHAAQTGHRAKMTRDREAAHEVLVDRRYRGAVDQDSARLRELGARGVPLYAIDGTWAIPGAQSVETYLEGLKKAAAAS